MNSATSEVWASYAVVTVGDSPPPELFYAGVSLPFGHVQFFVNRETGLVTVNTIKRGQKGGTEVYSARLTHGAKAD